MDQDQTPAQAPKGEQKPDPTLDKALELLRAKSSL
jgi:hypothetical protein